MEVDFVKIDPTQNMTILVTSPLDRACYRDVAEKIMAYENVYAEQVGFLEKPENPQALARLQMAGGEFCGNASLSLCAYLVWKGRVECGESCRVPIEVSGADGILFCDIKKAEPKNQLANNCFLGKIEMPVPETIKDFCIEIGGESFSFPLVYMPGISHVIVDIETVKLNEELLVETMMSNIHAFTNEDAMGVMFYDKTRCRIRPFVYVKTAGTKVWEKGCGSGTASLGAYLAHVSGKNVEADVVQPGGTIRVEAEVAAGKITKISIEGKIVIAAEGKAYLN